MHPSQDIKGMKSHLLKDKTIILGVTGSIAAVETIKLSRELIRHDAMVIPVMTPAATRIIHPDALWFATGMNPIVDLTGETEHVSYCGDVPDHADLLLISPCTANTISKIANGIDDTAVTTFATTAIGANHPVMIVPAMHKSMYDHRIVQKNIHQLKEHGIDVVDPYLEKKKAKLASIEEITARVIRRISENTLNKKRILIIGGSCCESVDKVRSVCNLSSGKTAISFTRHAYYHGAEVELWYGTSPEQPPNYVKTKRFRSLDDVKRLIKETNLEPFEIIIVCAALSDYIPEKINEKLDSTKESVKISLKKADKIIRILRRKCPKGIIIGFKLDDNKNTVIEKAKKLQKDQHLDLVVANTISAIQANETTVLCIDSKTSTQIKGSKDYIADQIFSRIISMGSSS